MGPKASLPTIVLFCPPTPLCLCWSKNRMFTNWEDAFVETKFPAYLLFRGHAWEQNYRKKITASKNTSSCFFPAGLGYLIHKWESKFPSPPHFSPLLQTQNRYLCFPLLSFSHTHSHTRTLILTLSVTRTLTPTLSVTRTHSPFLHFSSDSHLMFSRISKDVRSFWSWNFL